MMLLAEKSKTKTSWCFVDGVRFVYRERREPRDGEIHGLRQRIHDRGTSTLVLPAIKYSSTEEFQDLAMACVDGTAPVFNAVALSIESIDKKFLWFINKRAREGQNLYFDIFVNDQKVAK